MSGVMDTAWTEAAADLSMVYSKFPSFANSGAMSWMACDDTSPWTRWFWLCMYVSTLQIWLKIVTIIDAVIRFPRCKPHRSSLRSSTEILTATFADSQWLNLFKTAGVLAEMVYSSISTPLQTDNCNIVQVPLPQFRQLHAVSSSQNSARKWLSIFQTSRTSTLTASRPVK